jgi:hypothetical protein
MEKAVVTLQQRLTAVSELKPSRDRIAEAIDILFKHGVARAVETHARFLCWGMTFPDKSLLKDGGHLVPLLSALRERMADGRLSLFGWRGLLEGYLLHDPASGGRAGWEALRELLRMTLPMVTSRARFKPDWLTVVNDHLNLLTPNPCDRYAVALFKGDTNETDALQTRLQIAERSWFWRELILSQVRHVTGLSDAEFVACTPAAVTSVRRFPVLTDDALVLLLTRHASTLAHQPSEELQGLAVTTWGSPNLSSQARWNLVDPPVKRMVQEWLVREDLKDFFALLQQDGAADERRLQFWLRYAKQIDYAHFALGPYAYESIHPDYVELRKKRLDRICRLTNAGDDSNNAFILKIKDLLLVEFGQTNNACFIYKIQEAPFNINQAEISRYLLKRGSVSLPKLSHVGLWENRFETILRDLGVLPDTDQPIGFANAPHVIVGFRENAADFKAALSSRPAAGIATQVSAINRATVVRFAQQNRLVVIDNTAKIKGALWVIHNKTNDAIAKQLEAYGMKYAASRGWWMN